MNDTKANRIGCVLPAGVSVVLASWQIEKLTERNSCEEGSRGSELISYRGKSDAAHRRNLGE